MTLGSARSSRSKQGGEEAVLRADGAQQGSGLPPPPPAPARPKERRRPLLIAAMVALVCLGGLVSAYAYVYPDPAVSLCRLIVTFR